MNTLDLNELRNEINEIDAGLVQLFEKRMELVAKVAEYKIENEIPVLNSEREAQVIKQNLENLKNKDLKNEMEKFFHDVMEISKDFQNKYIRENHIEYYNDKKKSGSQKRRQNMKIGFQGIQGSFSEEALFNYFGEGANTTAYQRFEDVFIAISENKVDYGILPVENSSTGSVTEVYDLLRKYGCHINGEIVLRVRQNLLGVKGATIDDIEEVYSHNQGFKQSAQFFQGYPEWKLIPYHNTALSAKLVSEAGDKSKAAVASDRAASIYGLDILKDNLNFNSNNYTRFVIVGKKLEPDESSDKISVVLTLLHKAGTLYNILQLFSEKGLNLMKLESRPIMGKSWEYFFYMDFEGNLENPEVKQIMELIKTKTTYFKILGNYKKND